MSSEQPPNSTPNINAGETEVSGRQPRRRGGRGRGRGRRGSGPDAAGRADGDQTNPESKENASQRPNNGRRRGRRGRGGGQKPSNEQQPSVGETPSSPRTEQALEFIADSLADASVADDGNNSRSNKNNESGVKERNAPDGSSKSNDANTQPSEVTKKKKRKNRNRRRNKMPESRPWLSAIPPDAMDPISLDPLDQLAYPPFALVMDEPYTPIYPGMWPPPELDETDEKKELDKSDAEKDREMSILKAQWGEGLVQDEKAASVVKNGTKSVLDDSNSLQGRKFYLFDGLVLAGYLTMTKQFINPYNRRDLTRPELEALDAYMKVHKLGNAGVLQAYGEMLFLLLHPGTIRNSTT